jgi:hypothetical protein
MQFIYLICLSVPDESSPSTRKWIEGKDNVLEYPIFDIVILNNAWFKDLQPRITKIYRFNTVFVYRHATLILIRLFKAQSHIEIVDSLGANLFSR